MGKINQKSEEIQKLHYNKGLAYGISWRKRGEIISIIPNILRKSDRLENLVLNDGVNSLDDESVLDTYEDLFVYLCKYYAYILNGTSTNEEETALANELIGGVLHDGVSPASDEDEVEVLTAKVVDACNALPNLVMNNGEGFDKDGAILRVVELSVIHLSKVIAYYTLNQKC